MEDWRSYENIAEAYERNWQPRMELVARHLLELASLVTGRSLLDVGTGTGAVLAAIGERLEDLGRVAACDRARAMLRRAKSRFPRVQAILADARALPFPARSFDVVTANLVVSHLRDYPLALVEAKRVLGRSGSVCVSGWGRSTNACAGVWTALLGEVGGPGIAELALAEIAPAEAHFSDPARMSEALRAVGFAAVHVEVAEVSVDQTLEEYLADRALSAGGRCARAQIGEARWQAFLARAAREIEKHFGKRLCYTQSAIMGTGSKD